MTEIPEILEKAILAYNEFRANYHRLSDPISPGSDGSTLSPGQHTLLLRSRTVVAGRLFLQAAELLNGSGELPDSTLLRSYAESMGAEPVDFICTLWSLMGAMDVRFLIDSGDGAMALRVFVGTMNGKVPVDTWGSMSLKKAGTPGNMPLSATGPASITGRKSNPAARNPPPARRRKPSNHHPGRKKKQTSARKKAVRRRKQPG